MSDDATPPTELEQQLPAEQPILPPQAPLHPTWTYFLTPIAVLIGSGIIGGFVLLGWALFGGSSSNNEPSAAVSNLSGADGGVSSLSASPTPTSNTRTVFAAYATQLGLNQAQWSQCTTNQATADIINKQIQQGAALGVSGTPTFFINNAMLVGAQPFSVLKEVIDVQLQGNANSIDAYPSDIQALAKQNPPYFKLLDSKPSVSGGQIEGSSSAKVTVMEFTDFQCPFCERWFQEDLPQLRKMLGSDVALEFVNFPIPQLHPNAGGAAMAAQCAAEQGKFWQMHDLLFGNQAAWENLPAT